MLIEKLIKELKSNNPDLEFSVNEKERSITIPSQSSEVGSVKIFDDSHEIFVGVGGFTHWHASCFEEKLSQIEQADSIISEVIDFLTDLFDDKIVMWGSNERGGGFYHIEGNLNEQDAPLQPEKELKYVWSGKSIS